MKFEEALKAMREGKKIARKKWINNGTEDYYFIKSGEIWYYSGIDFRRCYMISENILAEDWEAIDE